MKKYESFAHWAADQSPPHRKLINALRKLVKQAAPRLVETVKWGNGCYARDDMPVTYLHAAPDHLQLGFFAGAMLDDPKGLLVGSGKFVRHVKIRTPKDIDSPYLGRLVRQAIRVDYR